MTWTATETPHEGDSTGDGLSNGLGSGAGGWQAEPLPPGALGADPHPDPHHHQHDDQHDDDGGLFTDQPPLPLTGPLAEALTTTRTGADAAADAACYLASLSPEQRLDALTQTAHARDVLEATLLRLTATFTPDEVRALGATCLTDLLLTHTGASPARASTEVKLAAALTAPELPLPVPAAPADDQSDPASDPASPTASPGHDPATGSDPATSPGAAGPAGPTGPTGPAAGSSQLNLARLGAAHARGDVSTDITALALRTVADLPARIRRTHMATADATLTHLLPGTTHTQATTICTALAHTLDPDRADRGYDPDDIDRRYLNYTLHPDGFLDLRARLDPVTGAELKAALDHLSKPDPTTTAPLADQPADAHEVLPGLDGPDETDRTDCTDSADARGDDDAPRPATGAAPGSTTRPGVQVRDERTAAQRRADALALLVRTGRASDHTRGGEGARVIITTTSDALHGVAGAEPAHCETTGRPLSTAALRTLACAGSLQAVVLSCTGADAEVLALGRAVRLFSAGQRRAMLARDGGCLIPGCTAPPGWLEAHHVHEWAAGGLSDVSNGVLLCTRHHVLVTIGVWAVRMVNGVPHIRPPRSVDPLRRWVLNPRPSLREATTHTVRQLQPTLLEPPDPPPDADVPDIPSPHSTCGC